MKYLFLPIHILLLSVSHAQDEYPVHWKISTQNINDSVFIVHMKPTINTEWHIYSQVQPKNSVSTPTSFKYESNDYFKKAGPTHEVGTKVTWRDTVSDIAAIWYESVDFTQRFINRYKLTVAVMNISITYQPCTEEMCLPPKTELFKLQF